MDEAVQKCLRDVARFLRKNKVSVKVNARPDMDSGKAYRNYIQLLRAATSKRLMPKEFQNNLKAFAKLSPRRKDYEAQAIRAQAMYHRDWLLLNEERHHMRLAWAEFWPCLFHKAGIIQRGKEVATDTRPSKTRLAVARG